MQITLPVSVVMLIPGIIMLAISPNKKVYNKELNRIDNKIKKYQANASFDIFYEKENIGFSLAFKF